MEKYRVNKLDMSTRIEIAMEILPPIPVRRWGRVTELANEYGISREWIYQLRNRAKTALEETMRSKSPGRPVRETELLIDREMIQRAIAIMPVLTGSVRNIQIGLEILFGVQRSVGYISETLQQAGKAADRINRDMQIPLPVLGEADEIFQGGRPCLTVVDGRSFLVLNLAAADRRDATHWGLTFLELAERGIVFHDMVCDGAKGLRTGLKDAEIGVPLRPDWFHLLRDAHKITQRLERAAYKAIDAVEYVREELCRPKPKMSTSELSGFLVREQRAIDLFDTWCWLLEEVRQCLEPITPKGQIQCPQLAQEILETAILLMNSLAHREISDFAAKLLEYQSDLLAPLTWLSDTLKPWRDHLNPTDEAFIIWAWLNRQNLNITPDNPDWPSALQPILAAFWQALALFHRSSSLAESLHCWLRPYLQIHRGMPQWLFPLLQLFWNHHVFSRGKRSGDSPLALAGVPNPPSLFQAFDTLFTVPAVT
jgi:hypothetical protein